MFGDVLVHSGCIRSRGPYCGMSYECVWVSSELILCQDPIGGPWLSESQVGPSTFSRLCRCITGHAPLGVYRQRFNIGGAIHCPCLVGHGILETRSHALHSCPRWKHPGLHSLLDTIPTLTKFVQMNAAFCAIVHPQLAWDPG
jgi:hypothetical protein